MSNFDFNYTRYVGRSNRSDRFFGLDCGCVVVARGFKVWPDNAQVPTDMMHTCCGQHQEAVKALDLPFDWKLFDMFVSDTYTRAEGTPWQ